MSQHWDDIVAEAANDPGRALVRLFHELESDLDWREQVGRECWNNSLGHQRAVEAALDGLREASGAGMASGPDRASGVDEASGTRGASPVGRGRAMVFVEALDQYLHEMDPSPSAERPPRCVDVAGHEYWLVSRGLCWARKAEQNSLKWQRWLRRHWVMPTQIRRRSLQLRAVDPATRRELLRVAGGELRVAIASFSDQVEPKWRPTKERAADDEPVVADEPVAEVVPEQGAPEQGPPRGGRRPAGTSWQGQISEGLCDLEIRWQSLERILTRATEDRADWLVLPELTVSPDLRLRVADWLHDRRGESLWLVLAGSYHEEAESDWPAESDWQAESAWQEGAGRQAESDWENRAVLLGADGEFLLRHSKFAPYNSEAQHFHEDVRPGRRVEVLAGPLGSMAVGICRDCCEEEGFPRELWSALGPGVLFVPSMDGSEGLRAYQRRAEELGRAHATITLQANQPVEAAEPAGSRPHRGLVCAPDRAGVCRAEVHLDDYLLWTYNFARD